MNSILRYVIPLVALTAMVGCSGSGGGSSGGGAGGNLVCSYSGECINYTNLTASQLQTEKAVCNAITGSSEPSSCPSANLVGCCTLTASSPEGYASETCYYGTGADAGAPYDQSACTGFSGTWSTSQ